MQRSERIQGFVQEIWRWYAIHKRTLPWRDLAVADDMQRGYMILVSEIMLQQTQVSRVRILFKEFLHRFPALSDLAAASNKEMIIVWRGMGYNSRALRLRDAARVIVHSHQTFPTKMSVLTSLPGIGHYTAAAIRNFAFNLPTPCLDTNIRRILHRTFVGPENADGTWRKNDQYLLRLAVEVLECALRYKPDSGEEQLHVSTAEWHAALMDFGSLVCTKTNPKWRVCPLTAKGLCKASYKVPVRKAVTVRREPGRRMGSVFIPNRIFRGRIVEQLRDEPHGLTLAEIGRHVCLDWSEEQTEWLQCLVQKLVQDRILSEKKGTRSYVLAE